MSVKFKTCREAVSYLSKFQFHGFRLGLERIDAVLKALGAPHGNYPCIHVAGTNGKGSVCAALSHVLSAAGFRTGLYSSPHLHELNERFRLNMEPVSDADLGELIGEIAGLTEKGLELSYFEFTTAMAFAWFARMDVDVAVIETGLGGRLDATNVIDPVVSVITNISLEHQSYLGTSPGEIAREKAGIIKKGVPLVTGSIQGEASDVILERARELECPVACLGRDFRITPGRSGKFDYSGPLFNLKGLRFGLAGGHQLENAATALASLEMLGGSGLGVSEEALRSGLVHTSWPGRSEFFNKSDLLALLDGAHNGSGVVALDTFLKQEISGPLSRRRKVLLWACSDEGGDKDFSSLLGKIAPLFERIVITEPPGPRKPVRVDQWQAQSLDGWPVEFEPGWKTALEEVLAGLSGDFLLVVSGSLYLVGAVRKALMKMGFKKDRAH